jgi:hypothetical protein
MAELRDELAVVQRETVSAASVQRAVAFCDPIWDLLLVPERFRILHLLLEAVVYDGATGELRLAFYRLASTARLPKPPWRSQAAGSLISALWLVFVVASRGQDSSNQGTKCHRADE